MHYANKAKFLLELRVSEILYFIQVAKTQKT